MRWYKSAMSNETVADVPTVALQRNLELIQRAGVARWALAASGAETQEALCEQIRIELLIRSMGLR